MGDLDHTTAALGHVLLLHRIIRCAEVHGLVDESFTAGTGTYRLIVDLWTTRFRQVSEPALVNLGREGRSCAIQPFSS